MNKIIKLAEALENLNLHLESQLVLHLLEKEAAYNQPRAGKKRWSIKQKRAINCSNPKGFSQKQYCKRKSRGGSYKK
jgi:hypothetical protein